MRKQTKGNEALTVVGATAVAGIFAYGIVYMAKLINYNMFYKGMVKETIREENEK